jgi:hypothetical protein
MALINSSAAAASVTGRCTSWANLRLSCCGWLARVLLLAFGMAPVHPQDDRLMVTQG